jgi:hypothetical protein
MAEVLLNHKQYGDPILNIFVPDDLFLIKIYFSPEYFKPFQSFLRSLAHQLQIKIFSQAYLPSIIYIADPSLG